MQTQQFKEDASGMAHPIRPESVVVQDNFYTTTVYEKGAEVIRMIHSLLGERTFRQGMDSYFSKFDGQAVTCDDFRLTMAEAAANAGRDDVSTLLRTSFERWYSQDGTPEVEVTVDWNEDEDGTAILRFSQSCAPSVNQPDPKKPFVIPVRLGFFDSTTGRTTGVDATTGSLMLAASDPGEVLMLHGNLAVLSAASGELRLKGIPRCAAPSLLRDFSAPVKLSTMLEYDPLGVADIGAGEKAEEIPPPVLDAATTPELPEDLKSRRARWLLGTRMAADPDPVSRYDSAQQLALRLLRDTYHQSTGASEFIEGDGLYFDVFEKLLGDASVNPALRAQILSMPTFSTFVSHELQQNVSPLQACNAMSLFGASLAERFSDQLLKGYHDHASLGNEALKEGKGPIPYKFSTDEVSRRRYANFCLHTLAHIAHSPTSANEDLRQQVCVVLLLLTCQAVEPTIVVSVRQLAMVSQCIDGGVIPQRRWWSFVRLKCSRPIT